MLVLLPFILQAHLYQKHCLFGSFSLFFGCSWQLGGAVWFYLGCRFFILCFQSNIGVAHLFFSTSLPSCLSLLAYPLPPNQRKLTSSRTGEIELYYFSFGNLTLLPYLKAIVFYISWQEFSSTSDP